MAFSADELRVLRRALASALHPAPLVDEDVQDCLRLADSVDEAVREAGRLRTFLLADLVRYREALPGSAAGYLELLQDALAAGYDPRPEDLAALRTLRGHPVGAAVLRRCQTLAEHSVRARLAGRAVRSGPSAPTPRARLLALPGGRAADEPKPQQKPREKPQQEPRPKAPAPGDRPVPKPSEVFPPRRKPVPPPEQLAAG
ncbi:hypothetical protein FBY35_3165 [Streptomyces sp. SLBN-118]|uniref:hypothetical protein n=1 Tax=Streptomyces sp. SLBN-118 TaxID=2768454 RepID=UPI00116A39A1|nr:hypothetical protein [Streptomyces sp. SLBN-118]TQK52717.1 hypothetical protein FBY35_3165 [Streptomyces sp. SLBN-118]